MGDNAALFMRPSPRRAPPWRPQTQRSSRGLTAPDGISVCSSSRTCRRINPKKGSPLSKTPFFCKTASRFSFESKVRLTRPWFKTWRKPHTRILMKIIYTFFINDRRPNQPESAAIANCTERPANNLTSAIEKPARRFPATTQPRSLPATSQNPRSTRNTTAETSPKPQRRQTILSATTPWQQSDTSASPNRLRVA